MRFAFGFRSMVVALATSACVGAMTAAADPEAARPAPDPFGRIQIRCAVAPAAHGIVARSHTRAAARRGAITRANPRRPHARESRMRSAPAFGMRAAIDPVTGELVAPTPEQMRAPATIAHSRIDAAASEIVLSDGTVIAPYRGAPLDVAMASVDSAGNLRVSCGPAPAKTADRAARP